MQAGDLAGAEASLIQAGELWAAQGDDLALARSGLGLTQILALQGRFAEAESTIRRAIATLTQLDARDLEQELLLAAAEQNLATLLSSRSATPKHWPFYRHAGRVQQSC